MKTCTVDQCGNETRSLNSKYCEKHYYRIRRNGSVDLKPFNIRIKHSGGYDLVYSPNHPLRQGHVGNYEYEHRVVYYNNHGVGPFACHWCGDAVSWQTLHVDHLNDNKKDNRIENLVASCAICNQHRGVGKMTSSMRSLYGVWLEFQGKRRMLTDWAKHVGISRSSLQWRIKSGWTIERALTEPRGKFGPRQAA
jgi:hypothetical protein